MQKMMPFLAISLALSALLWQSLSLSRPYAAQAQMPPAMPGPDGQPFLREKRLVQNEDEQIAAQARNNYQNYSQRVREYIEELQSRLDETHAMRGKVEKRVTELHKNMTSMSPDQRERSITELESLKSWLSAESGLNAQAEKNVRLCQSWLAHERAEMDNAEYNASEAQQQIADEQLKMRQAQSELERQQRMMRDQQYWEDRNEDPYYPLYGRGRGWGRGYGYGHYSHGPSGGGVHSGGGGVSMGHGGGGHGGGHR